MRHSISIVTAAFLGLALIFGAPGVAFGQLERAGAWAFGPSYAVDDDADRKLAYIGSGGVVRIVDISKLENPELVADIHSHGLVEDIFYDPATQRLYLAGGEGGLEIWDVATPASPALLSRSEVLYFNVETPVGNVKVIGDYAAAECEWGYVHTVDVSDPTAPVQVAFNGVMGNPAYDMNLGTDGQIHATGAQFYVRLDVLASGAIDLTGQRHFDFGAGAVFGTPEVAYVGHGSSMVILDLLLPGFPPWSITNVGGIREIEVLDGRAYLINNDGLRIWDVTVHNAPFFLGQADREYLFKDMVVTPPYAYIAASGAGLEMHDISDPEAPSIAASYTDVYGGTSEVEVRGGYAYVADFQAGLVIVDRNNLEAVEVGRYDTPGSAYDLALAGNLAFVADVDGGLRIADITDPAAPSEVGFLDDFHVWRVEPYGDVVYAIESIVNQPYLLHTIDVSTPSAPVDLGAIGLPDSAWGFARRGDTLFVAADAGGVMVFDVSVPTAPALLTSYPIPDVTDLDIVGDVLYVASYKIAGVDGGLYVLDISDLMAPDELAHLSDPGFLPFHVAADGDFAYAVSGEDLRLYDVSDPSSPVELDEYRAPWTVFGVTQDGGTVYLPGGRAGLQVVDNTAWVETFIFTDGFESGDTAAWSTSSGN